MNRLATILLSALLLLGACATEQPESPDATAADETPEVALSSEEPSGPPRPGRLSEGYVQAASLDGSAVYVSDKLPGSEGRGCEAAGDYVLYRVPLDGSERSLATNEPTPLQATFLRGGSNRRVVLVDGCEENPFRAYVATESESGRLGELQRLPLPEQQFPRITGWSNDGLYLLGITGEPAGPEKVQVVQIDPTSGDKNVLFDSDPIYQVVQLKNGSYVTVGAGGAAVRSTTKVERTFKGSFIDLAPTGDRFTIRGNGLSLVAGQGEAQVLVEGSTERDVYAASFSPDGKEIAYIQVRSQGPKVQSELAVIPVGGQATVIESSGPKDRISFGSPFFTPDGKFLVYNQTPDDGSNPPDVVLVALPD